MKLTKYGMLLGAMALLASCSSDNIDGPEGNLEGLDAAYFTVNIHQNTTTRTVSPNSGTEAGEDSRMENDINNVTLIIADETGNFLAKSAKTLEAANQDKTYTETFKIEGDGLTNLSGYTGTTVKVFVVCNVSSEDSWTFTKGEPVQKNLTIDADNGKYCTTAPNFLMSNADQNYSANIDVAGIKSGKYADGKEVHSLGTVNVQRAVARFDIAPTQPTGDNYKVKDTKIKINFDAVALLNLNKKFYLFKEVTTGARAATSNETWEYFAAENGSNWVLDPTDKVITGSNNDYNSWFIYPASNQAVGLIPTERWTSYTALTVDDNENINWPEDATEAQKQREYKFWRYVTPNNVFGAENQKHGNTTGVVFRAEIKKEESTTFTYTDWGSDDIYAYGDIIYGSFDDLAATAASPGTDVNSQAMAVAFNSTTHTDESVTAEDLAKNGSFKKFSPVGDKYYCYYYYWNRHNDNTDSEEMGNMEFQVVRNNVYKLCVTKVTGLGVPGTDTPDPGTPDEEKTTEANFMVEVNVIPWYVRVNDIEF